jgi:hypothetical protein
MPAFLSPSHLANIAGHALVGCASSVAQGGRCGPGALSAAAGSFAGPILKDLQFEHNLVAHAVVGGLASVAGGGRFANGAVTAAFGYLFNDAALLTVKGSILMPWHSAVWIWNDGEPYLLDQSGSYRGDVGDGSEGGYWSGKSADIERFKKYWNDRGETVDVTWLKTSKADDKLMVDWLKKDQDRGGLMFACTVMASECLRQVPSMKDLPATQWPSTLYNAVQKYKIPAPPQFSPKP